MVTSTADGHDIRLKLFGKQIIPGGHLAGIYLIIAA